jgi:hypothetical protein
VERFAIRTDLDTRSLLNASQDETGRPGSWHALLGLPRDAQVVAVVSLPCGQPAGSHEATRLLISYRLPEPERATFPIDWHAMLDARGRPVDGAGRLLRNGWAASVCNACGHPSVDR